MRIATAIIAAAMTACAAAPAFAQSDRVSDVEYLQAARCKGLIASEALGAADTASIDAFLNAQTKGRNSIIIDKAEQTTATAKKAAKRAGAERKASMQAELSGACARFIN